MDNDILTIYENDIDIAQNLCNSIGEDNVRNRAVANVLAVKLAARYFSSKDYDVDTTSGLHNIPNVLENLDIADIYINGAYIDVRIYFSNEELSIPKLHFDLNMNPAAYMFIKLDQNLSSYNVAGFIRPEFLNKNNLKDDYYYIEESDLASLYDIESHLAPVNDTFDGSKEILYSFVDGSIDENNITKLMNILMTSKNARNTLIKAFKAKNTFKYISTPIVEETKNAQEADTEDTETASQENKNIDENDLNEFFDTDSNTENTEEDLLNALEYSTEVTPNELEALDNNEQETNNDKQIDSLFTGEQEGIPVAKKKSSAGLVVLLLIVLIAAGGYFGYTKLSQQEGNNSLPYNTLPEVSNEKVSPKGIEKPKEEAMPIETVNNTNLGSASTEEASAVAIPAIEQHLDASVLVANLKVDWEVPAGYASNTAAKRYFIKLGKIIQLNLKSELLLLNKPPISNKITVELHYNTNMGKFDIVGIKDSSGEKTVDDAIVKTIQNALSTSSNSNTDFLEKLQGNPVLVIHL